MGDVRGYPERRSSGADELSGDRSGHGPSGFGQGGLGQGGSGWQPPGEVERRLYEAATRADWHGYLRTVAASRLFHHMSRLRMDANPGKLVLDPTWHPAVRAECVSVFTEGMLPEPAPTPVYFSAGLDWYANALEQYASSLGWFARRLGRRTFPPYLIVNPGTPCQAAFPTGRDHLGAWRQHAFAAPKNAHGDQLHTLHRDGLAPRTGALAHGLACGALLSVRNGSYWNVVGWHGLGYPEEVECLSQWWSITDRAGWLSTVEGLLRGDMVNEAWEFVLQVRNAVARGSASFGSSVDVAVWRREVERLAREHIRIAPSHPARGDSGGAGPESPAETEEFQDLLRMLDRVVGLIVRYEARFRGDGLLPEGRCVTSVAAWDYGRAANMARWGLGARYCTREEAESAVLRAGRVSALVYRSWEEFSVGHILGRCLHFDGEEFGAWYQDMLSAHRVLTTDPSSPWLTLPFR